MRTLSRGFVCRLLALLMVAAPYAAQTQAAMIGSEQAIAASTQAERDTVSRFMTRSDVQRQLAALGAPNAAERVAALSDDEVRQLAGKIDALPAGADSGITLLLIVVLILLVFVLLDWKK
jgi:hypothetical protein